jgi:hypothetical protein
MNGEDDSVIPHVPAAKWSLVPRLVRNPTPDPHPLYG